MKLLTLNTHSLVEENYNKKLLDFVSAIAEEQPDIIALQEVNQSCREEIVPACCLKGFCQCDSDTIVRRDNHAYNVVKLLSERGVDYYWTWIGMKLGYSQYDEGIAILSRSKIVEVNSLLISGINDYNDWKTRKIIGICTENVPDTWFYSVHMGWWDDEREPFSKQWDRIHQYMKKYDKVWLMGDFNSPAQVAGEGYSMIEESGWYDSYRLAESKDSGITVGKVIDGWKEKISDTSGMRIDQIWCNKKICVKSSEVIFNDKNRPVVSDHYGILIKL